LGLHIRIISYNPNINFSDQSQILSRTHKHVVN